MTEESDIGSTKMLHRLAAIKIVREMELEEAAINSSANYDIMRTNIVKEIIDVAVENGMHIM